MSKTLIYGFIASLIGIGASATYFFPVIETINSYLHSGNSKSQEKVVISNETPGNQVVVSTSSIDQQASENEPSIENPSLNMNNDSIDLLLKKKSEYNPNTPKMLEGEIPTSKNY